MKKRTIIAITGLYWLVALFLIGLTLVVSGDCGVSGAGGDHDHCVRTADAIRNCGFLIALAGYPCVLGWYARRRRRDRPTKYQR